MEMSTVFDRDANLLLDQRFEVLALLRRESRREIAVCERRVKNQPAQRNIKRPVILHLAAVHFGAVIVHAAPDSLDELQCACIAANGQRREHGDAAGVVIVICDDLLVRL